MSKPVSLRTAASAIVLATMISGCAAQPKTVGWAGEKQGDVGLATRALAALNSNDIPTAIDFAERAVEKTPNDAGFRTLLGNAYFAGGRFKSAEAAYKDSLALVSAQPQAVLKLALVEIAQGKTYEALSLLDAARPMLDPANYGLALALAGRPGDAIAVLEPAARQTDADARVRQNLALAYALSGDWTRARTVAGQDVAANQLDARIQQWMQLANPSTPSDQVAALVGVKPAAADQGQPMRLALTKTDTQVATAAAVAAPAPQPVETAQGEMPTPVDAAVPVTMETPPPVVAEAPALAPVSMALMAAAAPEAPAAFAAFMPKKAPAAAKSAKPRRAAAAVHRGHSNAIMQLGSYRSPEQVAAGWAHLTQRYPALRDYLPMKARFDSPKGTFWRLSVQGFDSQREAIARCDQLKSNGGHCFVRGFAGDAPVQIASR